MNKKLLALMFLSLGLMTELSVEANSSHSSNQGDDYRGDSYEEIQGQERRQSRRTARRTSRRVGRR